MTGTAEARCQTRRVTGPRYDDAAVPSVDELIAAAGITRPAVPVGMR